MSGYVRLGYFILAYIYSKNFYHYIFYYAKKSRKNRLSDADRQKPISYYCPTPQKT